MPLPPRRNAFPSPLQAVRFLYHLPRMLVVLVRLLRDPRVPFRARVFAWFGFAYVLFPLDLLKDFPLVHVGFLDDVVVLYFCLRAFVRRVPEEILAEHLRR